MAFTRACALGDVTNDSPLAVTVDGVALAIVRQADDVYAIYDECSHAAIPLSEGEAEDGEIECWLHGSRFDLRTGKPSGPPATEPVPTYPVRLDGGDVLVDVTNPNSRD
jgi:3-phenylpropionate/trans-cinnamate dioxygenase ferredoxin subunit